MSSRVLVILDRRGRHSEASILGPRRGGAPRLTHYCIQLCRLSFRQPPALLLAMIWVNIALSAGALIV
jgi:hypothetical protein